MLVTDGVEVMGENREGELGGTGAEIAPAEAVGRVVAEVVASR